MLALTPAIPPNATLTNGPMDADKWINCRTMPHIVCRTLLHAYLCVIHVCQGVLSNEALQCLRSRP
eukprot:5597352-Alexandrium_andersonii.AAC.1